ncbi:hypothetical protein BDP27DRAFT_1376247 [Rhodocollybia butyracea]|uniref:Uncharacterized protein n=1 Tax=Rhodocollybia butyracea TaxID=206335 RepID=A0A9P5TV99_9AGAR|nr:hypothetical protein BDP27DRAFT_1376247 [Rhodocollybia butyracea]
MPYLIGPSSSDIEYVLSEDEPLEEKEEEEPELLERSPSPAFFDGWDDINSKGIHTKPGIAASLDLLREMVVVGSKADEHAGPPEDEDPLIQKVTQAGTEFHREIRTQITNAVRFVPLPSR